MAFVFMVFVFFLIAAGFLGIIGLTGLTITIISAIRREKAVREGREPHKAGIITGISLMAVPVLIVGGIVLYFTINSGKGSSYELATSYRDSLQSGIQNDDTQMIYTAFSEYTQSRHTELYGEIEEMFTFIKGDVESYTNLLPAENCEKYAENGSFEIQNFRGEIRDIVTSSGKTYEIHYFGYSQYDGDENRLGLEKITVKCGDEQIEVGIDTR